MIVVAPTAVEAAESMDVVDDVLVLLPLLLLLRRGALGCDDDVIPLLNVLAVVAVEAELSDTETVVLTVGEGGEDDVDVHMVDDNDAVLGVTGGDDTDDDDDSIGIDTDDGFTPVFTVRCCCCWIINWVRIISCLSCWTFRNNSSIVMTGTTVGTLGGQSTRIDDGCTCSIGLMVDANDGSGIGRPSGRRCCCCCILMPMAGTLEL